VVASALDHERHVVRRPKLILARQQPRSALNLDESDDRTGPGIGIEEPGEHLAARGAKPDAVAGLG
jgi:hypothetical protein